jgi:hypothetical protein
MTQQNAVPIMQIRHSDTDRWTVAATWPDGRSEEIGEFKNESQANKWVADKLQQWLDTHENQRAKG